MDVRVEPFADLDALEADARGALDRAAQANLYSRQSWLRTAAAHLPGSILVLRAQEGDARAWLPLAIERRHGRPPGSWYTLDYRPIFADVTGPAQRQRLLVAMARAARLQVARLTLTPLAAETVAELSFALRAAGWIVRHHAVSANWSERVAGMSFAEYWRDRPSRLQATVARKSRAAALTTEIRKRFDPESWSAFERVFTTSWKPPEGSSAFLRALAEEEGRAGTLRLGFAMLGDETVAAQMWLVENGVATIHKLAHARAHDALSPGTLLTAATMAAVIDGDRPSLLNFGAGDDRYKADWMAARAPLHTLEAADPRQAAGLLPVARWQAAALVHGRRLD